MGEYVILCCYFTNLLFHDQMKVRVTFMYIRCKSKLIKAVNVAAEFFNFNVFYPIFIIINVFTIGLYNCISDLHSPSINSLMDIKQQLVIM